MPRPFVGGTTFGWVVPVPKGAEVQIVSEEVFATLDRQVGQHSSQRFAKQPGGSTHFLYSIRKPIVNSTIIKTLREKEAWTQEHNMSMGDLDLERSHRVMEEYFRDGYHVFAALIPVQTAHKNIRTTVNGACAVAFQRAIIVFDNNQETLILQSQFHSQKVINITSDPIRISFPSTSIWYPMKASNAGDLSHTFISLDILTQEGKIAAPEGFQVAYTGKVRFEGKDYVLTRLEARMPFKAIHEDIHIPRRGRRYKK